MENADVILKNLRHYIRGNLNKEHNGSDFIIGKNHAYEEIYNCLERLIESWEE